MIKKINQLQNTGCFYDYSWDIFGIKEIKGKNNEKKREQEINFGKKNIIYGDNGNGKSTLVNILKYLNGDSLTIKKHRDRKLPDKDQKIIIDGNEYQYGGLKNNFIIFDKDFIKNNVSDIYSNNDIQDKKNQKDRGEKYFYLGGFDKQEEEYEKIVGKRESIKKDKSLEEAKKTSIENKYVNFKELLSIYKDNSFVKTADINEDIKKQREKIKNFEKQIDNFALITKQENLITLKIEKIDIEEYNKNFLKIYDIPQNIFPFGFRKEIVDITKHMKEKNIDECLICKNIIKNGEGEYIDRINKIINDKIDDTIQQQEKKIQDKLDELKTRINDIQGIGDYIRNINSINIERLNNELAIGKITGKPTFIFTNENNILLNSVSENIEEKTKFKTKQLNIANDLTEISNLIKIINERFEDYNKNISEINNKIAELKKLDKSKLEQTFGQEKQNLENLENSKLVLENIKDFKESIRLEAKIKKLSDQYDGMEIARQDKRKSINDNFKSFIEKYGNGIEKNLGELNSSIHNKISIASQGEYTRGEAKSYFIITLDGEKEHIGDCFSEGEKRSLALAYFFAQLEIEQQNIIELEQKIESMEKDQQQNKELGLFKTTLKEKETIQGNKIIIFDDPAVDFDNGHKQKIAEFINSHIYNYGQIFIFTHDRLFAEYLKPYNFDGKFWIYKVNGCSCLTSWNDDQIGYFEEKLKNFNKNGEKEFCELNTYVHMIRYCLENKIKRLMGFYESNFDGIINRFDKKQIERIGKIKLKQQKLKELYQYCNHNGSHSSITEAEGPNSIKKNIDKYFDLIKE